MLKRKVMIAMCNIAFSDGFSQVTGQAFVLIVYITLVYNVRPFCEPFSNLKLGVELATNYVNYIN
jgi:hypothetical protein